jgi:hypothetical protein
MDGVFGSDSNAVSRVAVVLNGSPLFTGGAGSGESEIRCSIIENDWLGAICLWQWPTRGQRNRPHFFLDVCICTRG